MRSEDREIESKLERAEQDADQEGKCSHYAGGRKELVLNDCHFGLWCRDCHGTPYIVLTGIARKESVAADAHTSFLVGSTKSRIARFIEQFVHDVSENSVRALTSDTIDAHISAVT